MRLQLMRSAIGAVLGWAFAVAVLFWLGIVPPSPLLMDVLLAAVVVLSMVLTVLLSPTPQAHHVPSQGPAHSDRPDSQLAPWHCDQPPPQQRIGVFPAGQQRRSAPVTERRDPSGWSQQILIPEFPIASGNPSNGVEPAPLGPPEPGPSTVLVVDIVARTGHEEDSADGRAPQRGALDLASQPGGSRIVQCPNCGDFEVDVRPSSTEFHFTCPHCARSWSWAPGSPWPPTVVRPHRKSRDGVPGHRPN